MAPLNPPGQAFVPSHDPSIASQLDDRSPTTVTLSDGLLLSKRDIGTAAAYNPGHSAFNPNDINNVGFFVLFALLGLGFVVSAVWFFFWARNGGFHFKKSDWSEYKSTVLRRKGPDGKTLSNATKSTKLGGGSVVGSEYTDSSHPSYYQDTERGSVDNEEAERQRQKKRRRHKKANKYDADVRAYRDEKPARVGGINKQPDSQGTVLDYSTAASNLSHSQPAMSEVSSAATQSRHHHGSHLHSASRSQHAPRRDFSFNQGSEASFSAVASDVSSNAPLRPQQQQQQQQYQQQKASRYHHHDKPSSSQQPTAPKRQSSSANNPKQYQSNRARRSANFYATRAGEGNYHEPINFRDDEEQRSAPSEVQVQNTKSYKHTIPGLSKGPAGPVVGFRRGGGGGGRRDSLSDSEDDGSYLS